MISMYLFDNCPLSFCCIWIAWVNLQQNKYTQFRSVYYNGIDIMRINYDMRAPKLRYVRQTKCSYSINNRQVLF